jgi:pimeloyl-ACP methyl ester carboxylesterase/tetratricopeptide (TPR) repeat protein
MTYSETGPGVQGISVSGEGVRFTVERGVVAGARSDGATIDPVANAINATDGLQIAEAMSIRNLELTGAGGRGGAGEGALVVDLGRSADGEQRVVLVEEDGRYTWALPPPGQKQVRLALEPRPGSRGLVGKAVRRVLRVVAVKTVGWAVHAATGTIVGAWDERRHPHRLRVWTPEDHQDPNAPPPDLQKLSGAPALLVIHGFMGSIHGSFGDLKPEVVSHVHQAYGGRTFAFDHPTLAASPVRNTQWLVNQLTSDSPGLELDILAHSRGGLVARELARQLTGNDVTVRSITFVATPNDGTPLADPKRPQGLLDTLTNLAGAVPGSDALQLVLELLKDIVVGSAFTGLEGLVAMEPGGPYLTELNNWPVPTKLQLRAIAADFEPRSDAGLVRTARDRLIDAYFGGVRNDLIVPTLSTIVTSGTFRVRARDRLVLDSSRGVDHSSFWTNDRAVKQLKDWLRPDWDVRPPEAVPEAETEPAAEVALPPDPRTIRELAEAVNNLPEKSRKVVEELVGGPISKSPREPNGGRAVVVIPGIMGTHLRRQAGELIWIDPVRLMRGHFGKLSLAEPAEEMEPAGLNRTYLPLITRLAEDWDVYLAPFDWRLDIGESATNLADLLRTLLTDPIRQVHLVAHSMGGLVARALTVVAPDVWSDLGAKARGDSGRLIMLGTPNRGSYAIVLTLTGAEMILKALATVDFRADTRGLVEIIATFPGVYQMLPSPTAEPGDDRHTELFTAATWGRWPVTQRLLDGAAEFHRVLEEKHQELNEDDLRRMTSVAGYGHPTPYRLGIDKPGSFSVGRIGRGDGRVAMTLNHLEKVTRYYCTASHGGLPSAPEVLDSLPDLLAGNPGKLEQQEPTFRSAEVIDRPPMVPVDQFDPAPAGATRGAVTGVDWHQAEASLATALAPSLGGGAPAPEQVQLEVRVVHASLEQAKFPVAVGHYAGLPIGGAEAFLDTKLRGALRQRQSLGQFPERAGSALYVPAPPGHRPHGALVLGLGEFGSLTGANLSEAMTQAVIALVLDQRERGPDLSASVDVGISSVLVGCPGRHGLTIENTVTSLVEGVIEAVARLRRQDDPGALRTIELELIESYQQPAEDAAQVLGRLTDLLEPSLREQVELLPHERLEARDGRQPGARPRGGSGNAWVRVQVGLERDDQTPATSSGIRQMTFSTLARGAQANLFKHDIDLSKIGAYVDAAVRRPEQDSAVNRTLFELLFPPRAKLDLDRTENLHLIVDKETAQLPWELLSAAAVGRGVKPLALRAGMLRQLQSEDLTRYRTGLPRGRTALFVGDPPTSYPRLPNAREEAERLAALFGARGWMVERCIYGDTDTGDANEWMDILNTLYEKDHRVVHIAAHGVFDDDDWRRSGVALGPMPAHRLTALDFAAMSSTPDLVFLNCCHLGRMGSLLDEAKPDARALQQPHRVAGTVAQQLLRNGVGAVVVAGWAVDDFAAGAFASKLYESMLGGYSFGDAVGKARHEAHEADGGRSNTWGAYQCYGDPDFELVADEVPRSKTFKPVSAAQLAREFDVAAVQASAASSDAECKAITEEVNRLRAVAGDLLDDGEVLEALGHAFSELGRYREAIDAYEQALRTERGEVRLRTAEQLANLKARLAVTLKRTPDGSTEQASKLFGDAVRTLDLIDRLVDDESAERLALRGSLAKKRATTLKGKQRTKVLVTAREAYLKARLRSSPDPSAGLDPYHTNNWLQLAVLTSESNALSEAEATWLDALYNLVAREAGAPSGYWEAAALADTLLTYLLAGRPLDGKQVDQAQVSAEYVEAFNLRSTVRQRDSALGHLEDLCRLVPGEMMKTFEDLLQGVRKGSPVEGV